MPNDSNLDLRMFTMGRMAVRPIRKESGGGPRVGSEFVVKSKLRDTYLI
jgi:hypothetical protein